MDACLQELQQGMSPSIYSRGSAVSEDLQEALTCGAAMQAGGLGSTGEGRVLDVCPEKVHQRVPLFIGSKKEVEYLESFYKK